MPPPLIENAIKIIIIVISENLLACNMPTVTITMSEKAYDIYRDLHKGHRSNIVSAALLQWNALKDVKWTVEE